MTSQRRFEQELPALLADLYLAGVPDYRDDLYQRIARTPQRPAWTFLERWLPMADITRSRVIAPNAPWRLIAVALVAMALLVGAVLVVGSQQRALPAPFGPAANGSIAFAADGDIYTVDAVTGATSVLIAGPEMDYGPVYSSDGTRIAFERKVDGAFGPGQLVVARDDGSGLVTVTPEPLSALAQWSFSPDGRSIVALATGDTGPVVLVVPTDGTGTPASFEVGATMDDTPPQYSPDGSEILFIGKQPGETYRGVYALDPATGAVRPIIAASATVDIHGASWSPDGTHVAYGTYDPNADGISARTRVAAADGSGDVAVDTHPDSIADGGSAWSNDGTRLIINRFYPSTDAAEVIRSVVVPIDRSGVGVEIGCPPGVTTSDCSANWTFSPDDSTLLGTLDAFTSGDMPQLLADPATGEVRSAPWTVGGRPVWQRLAP